MNLSQLIIIASAYLLVACKPSGHDAPTEHRLALAGHATTSPYFTADQDGAPVLCFTTVDSANGVHRLAYARYDTQSGRFGAPITVAGSEGTSASPEGMGKIAFKADGSVVAVFGKSFNDPKNRFAGAIYYTVSQDDGASWTAPRFLHTDSARTYGRQFFDLARLGNGEVGAVWLDGRDRSIKGSTLYFAATDSTHAFVAETAVHRGTCECCRTDLLVDGAGSIHIAYRTILYPAATFGEQVRDMAYVRSDDHGLSFTAEVPISADHWKVPGCPHTGPSLAYAGNALHAVWFTAGGTPGLYYTRKAGADHPFASRKLLTTEGTHPQQVAFGSDTLAVVYDRMTVQHADSGYAAAHGEGHGDPMAHDAGNGHQHGAAGAHGAGHHHGAGHGQAQGRAKSGMASTVELNYVIGGEAGTPVSLSTAPGMHHHPVIADLGDRLLVAWVSEQGESPEIAYRLVPR